MSPLKIICHITSVHPVKDVRIFYKECLSLANAGYKVYFIAQHDNSEIIEGINIVRIPLIKNRLLRIFILPFIIVFKSIRINASIYHFHDPELLFVGFLLRLFNKKVIYDVHENVPEQILTKPYLNKLQKGIISRVFKFTENAISRSFSGIITSTPTIKERFININKNTIDIKNYPVIEEIEPINWHEKKERSLCYIGGIFEERGILENIRCLDESMKLLLAGTVSTPSFLEQIKSLPQWKFVNFVGYINRKEINTILNRSKIGLLTLHPFPSYIVSMPIKLFEYMAAGIPVIASNFELWRTIIEENNCGICVDPLNIDEIKKAVNYLFDHEEIATQMGMNGRKLVLEKFNWKLEEKRLIEFYSTLI